MLNGILWKLATGAPWRDLPDRYGNWKTVYERYRRWAADGTFDTILTQVQVHDDSIGRIDWSVSVHRSAAPARSARSSARGLAGEVRPVLQWLPDDQARMTR